MGFLDDKGLAHLWKQIKKELADTGGVGNTTYLVKAPVGTIVIWSGTKDNIPAGWSLCDGQDGRPDLSGKFVLGAGGNHPVGETGGEEQHTLTVEEMPKHRHDTQYWTMDDDPSSAFQGFMLLSKGATHYDDQEHNTASAGGNAPHNNMPPYYALCYIIKIAPDETDGVTMEQVNAAINKAITGAMEKVYYGTGTTV